MYDKHIVVLVFNIAQKINIEFALHYQQSHVECLVTKKLIVILITFVSYHLHLVNFLLL